VTAQNPVHDLLAVGANPAIDRYYCLDDLRLGEINRVRSVRTAAGGKANNLARAYRRLGGSPLTTGIAAGESGRSILDGLTAEGIDHDYVLAEGESRQTVTVVGDGTTTVLLEPGPPISETAIACLVARVAARASTVLATVVSGSLPPGAPGDTVARLVAAARHSQDGLVAVDASGEALRLAALSGPHVIKVNRDEYECAFGRLATNLTAIQAHFESLEAGGLETLCLTDGPRGALFLSADEAFAVRTEADDPIATAGAGDAFFAGLLFALQRGYRLRDAARFASAAAAAALRRIGAGFIELSDVEIAMRHTRLHEADAFFTEPLP
jgi:tagatose 6-phosphate kinase